jgi:nucleoside 2-deoxyribosyltransferase
MQYRIVYVGAALTNASGRLKNVIPQFKQLLRDKTDTIVLRWVGMESEVDEGFYARDLGNVQMCDVMIAIVDEPSIGLGMEIAQAILERKPLLCLYKEGSTVSRMLEAAAKDGHLLLQSYKEINDATEHAADFIREKVSAVDA